MSVPQRYDVPTVSESVQAIRVAMEVESPVARCVDATNPDRQTVCLPADEEVALGSRIAASMREARFRLVEPKAEHDLLLRVKLDFAVDTNGKPALAIESALYKPGPVDSLGEPRQRLSGCGLDIVPDQRAEPIDNQWIAAELVKRLDKCHSLRAFAEPSEKEPTADAPVRGEPIVPVTPPMPPPASTDNPY